MRPGEFFAMPTPPYEEHVLGARDVCSNCLRLIRVERIDPYRSNDLQAEARLSRRERVTKVGYGPSEQVKDSKGIFCECGVESARHRIWDGDDVDRERFKDLIRHVIRTLELKRVTLKRTEAAAYALQKFDDGSGVDEALATGIEAGVVAAAAGGHEHDHDVQSVA
jgi:hypothetical protein